MSTAVHTMTQDLHTVLTSARTFTNGKYFQSNRHGLSFLITGAQLSHLPFQKRAYNIENNYMEHEKIYKKPKQTNMSHT